MSHDDMNNCSGFNEVAAAFSWNSPKKAINPYLDLAEVAPVSALSNLITLYAVDNEQEQLRREALSDQVWERYFFNESRDPVQREMEQDKLISRAKLAHEQQRFNPDMVILADVNAQPSHISKPLMQRIEYFSSLGRPKAYSRYLRETIKPCLERLEHVRDCQLSTSFRFMASHEGLDGLLILPEMSQDQVKRLAEPHHDGTVHWHLLCFMRKKDRRAITALLRKFAIREDREELGNNTGPRFKSELINPRKGTPTSYIAKYISKNIDGRGLAGEISKETGKSLRDNAEYVNAWASLHRVQQFRFFGIPGRQAYRELRLLAGQAARQQGDKKAGAPVLDNPRLDAILAAADAGCFATYIMKQGGVLVPRKYHLIRTAYEINEEPTAYGDHGIRIYGIWSPIAEGKICTHAVKWKMVRKAVDVQEAAADQGACAPWTRGNNCPLAENLPQQGKDKSADGDTRTDITRMNDKELHDYLHSMSKKERRELTARLRLVKPKRRKDYKQRITDHQRQQLVYELKSRGFDGSEKEVDLLLRGGSIPSGAGLRIFYRNQRLQEDDKWRDLY